MRVTIFDRPQFLQTLMVSLATFASLLLFGFLMAHWTWIWFAPRSELAAPPLLQTTGRISDAYQLFGNAQQNSAGIALAGQASTTSAIRLLGIVAASEGHNGYAVVQIQAGDILALREGENIAPGIRLAAVASDHLILERSGTRENLTWPEKNIVK